MSNIRYLNQQNPFWDWISTMESTGGSHPFFNAYNPHPSPNPRPDPPHHDDTPQPPNPHGPEHGSAPQHDVPLFGGRRGGPHHHGGPHAHRAGPHHGRGGPWSGRCGGGLGGFPMGGGNLDMSKIAEFISQFVPEEVKEGLAPKDASKDNKDFTPPADIFDTEDTYVVHVSLPGAKKEDVGVNWDADKSELNVAGVIYRPGDEEFLKTLALDERKIGVFERKVKLGSKTNPAQVDADGISAKMEDGVLMITIPKLDHDIVEVKKVDIE